MKNLIQEALLFWCESETKNMQLFAAFIVTPALSSPYFIWKKVWRPIPGNPTFKAAISPYAKEFFALCDSKQLYYIMHDLQIGLGFNERAIQSSLGMFKRASNWEDQEELCLQISDDVSRVMSNRESGIDLILNQERILSQKDLMNIKKRVEQQIKFIRICKRLKIQWTSTLNILTSDHNDVAVVGLLMKMGEFDAVIDMAPYLQVNLKDIIHGLVKKEVSIKAYGNSSSVIGKMFQDLAKTKKINYEIIVTIIIEDIGQLVADKQDILNFILKNVKYDNVKGKLLLKFGFLEEAFIYAKSAQDNVIISQIMEAADLVNNKKLVKQCKKVLGL